MAVYGVEMNQAISMATLGTNQLVTGHTLDSLIRSCSAIIFANAAAGSAGLYHFPAGDIYTDAGSRAVLRELIAAVHPTFACVAYGVAVANIAHPKPPNEPTDVRLNKAMTGWLAGQLGFDIQSGPAFGGRARVQIVAGAALVHFTEHLGPEGVHDLSRYSAGNYDLGFRIYRRQGGGPARGLRRTASMPKLQPVRPL